MDQNKTIDRLFRIEESNPEHPNWGLKEKKEEFYSSFIDFYARCYLPCEKGFLEDQEVDDFVFVSEGFMGYGSRHTNTVRIIPYKDEEELAESLDVLLGDNKKIAVYISEAERNIKLEQLVARASAGIGLEYDGDFVKSRDCELREDDRKKMLENIMETKKRRGKTREDIYNILNLCNIPAMRIDLDDGTERYSSFANSDRGMIYCFDILPEGSLMIQWINEQVFENAKEDGRYLEIPLDNSKTIQIYVQNNSLFKN